MQLAANRIAKNTSYLYVRMGITVFISLYSTRLILKALGAEDFGLFNLVGGIVVMLTFLNNAMTVASQRFMSFAEGEGNKNKLKNIFNVSIILHAIIAFIVVILLEIVGYFLFSNILNIPEGRIHAAKLIYQFLIVSTFFTIISVPYDAVINAHENMFFVAIIGILDAIIKLSIAFFITYFSADKLITYGLFTAILSILLLIIRQIYCRRKYSEAIIDFRKYFDKPLMNEMTIFAGWSFLGSTVGMLSGYGQGIVLNFFFGTIINAAQGIANQIAGQLGAFSSTMLQALNPIIVKSEGAGNRTGMLKATLTGTKISFFLLYIFALPAIILMPELLHVWLNKVPEFAIIFCQLLLIKNLFEQLDATLTTAIMSTGSIKSFQIFRSALASLPLIVSFIMFKLSYAPYIIYIVFIVQVLIRTSIVTPYYGKKLCGLNLSDFYLQLYIPCILSAAISIPAFLFVKSLLINVAYSYIYLSTLPLFTVGISFFLILNKEEKKNISQLISLGISKIRLK